MARSANYEYSVPYGLALRGSHIDVVVISAVYLVSYIFSFRGSAWAHRSPKDFDLYGLAVREVSAP